MRSGRAFPSTPIAAYAAQRARASLLLEASVTAPYRQVYRSAVWDRPRMSKPRGVVLQPYAVQRARASLVLEALVTAPYRQQVQAAVEGRKDERRFYGIETSYPSQRARASLTLEALVSPPATRTQVEARAPAQRRHGAVRAFGPPLAAIAAPPLPVTPPRTAQLISQERQARTRLETIASSYPAARAAASLALEALVAPPQTRLLVEAARQAGPHRHGAIQASYASARGAASLALEASVSPPSVRTLVEARAGAQHRHGVILSPRPVFTGVAPPIVTPPRTQTIVLAQMRSAHRSRSLVVAGGAPRTAPVAAPLPTIITAAHRRPVAHGHVTAPRPVLLPGQLRPQPRVVAPLPQRRRRAAGRVLTGAVPHLGGGFVPITSPSQGVFSDNPQTGLADTPSAAPFSDQAQTGLADSPRSGGWDKHL